METGTITIEVGDCGVVIGGVNRDTIQKIVEILRNSKDVQNTLYFLGIDRSENNNPDLLDGYVAEKNIE